MPHKRILFHAAAREKILRGATALADAVLNQYVDLIAAGIVDPTKVVRVALENAVSVASILLLTEATLTEVAEPAPKVAPEPALPMQICAYLAAGNAAQQLEILYKHIFTIDSDGTIFV